MSKGLSLNNIACLLKIEQVNGTTISKAANLDVMLTTSVVDVGRLDLLLVLSGKNVLVLNLVAAGVRSSHI